MKRSPKIPARLTVVALLHFALVRFLFQWLYEGRSHQFYFRFPHDFMLLYIAVAGACLVFLTPVLIRGDWVERSIATVLSFLPAYIAFIALRDLIRFFSYAFA